MVDSSLATSVRPAWTRRLSWGWVVLSSATIAALFVGQYGQGTLNQLARHNVGLSANYAAQPWPVQLAFYLHIGFGGLALVLGPFQFARLLRNRFPKVHRTIGRAYAVSVGLGTIGALVMSPYGSLGIPGFFGFVSLAAMWGLTTWQGYRAARRGDFRSHQAWMIRSFSLTYGAVTLRFWLGALIAIQIPFMAPGTFDHVFAQAYGALPYLGWIPNLVIAEFMLRRRGMPSLHITDGARNTSSATESRSTETVSV